jgi:hypothetical protein
LTLDHLVYFNNNLKFHGFLNVFSDYSSFDLMPVTTRLQAKRLIGSPKELPISTPINLPKELSPTLQHRSSKEHLPTNSTDSSKELPSPSLVPISSGSLTSSIISDHSDCLQFSSMTIFQNVEFQNFKSTNASLTPFLSAQMSLDFTHSSKMEADCKDTSNSRAMSKDMVNIAELISNLSTQITTQNQSIEERI